MKRVTACRDLGFSEDTIQRWAEEEDAVLFCGNPGGRGKKRKVSYRIPESIAPRMYEKHAQGK